MSAATQWLRLWHLCHSQHLLIAREMPLPEQYDGDAWRIVCQCLIQGSRDNIAVAQLSSLRYKDTILNSIASLKANGLDDIIPQISHKALQSAKLSIDTIQAQQKDLQSSFASISNMSLVFATLHQNAYEHIESLENRLQQEVAGLDEHRKMLETYSSFVSVSDQPQACLPETKTVLSHMRAAHQKMMKQHRRSMTRLKTLESSNKPRMEVAISVLQEMQTMSENVYAQAKSRAETIRARVEGWQREFEAGSRDLERILASAE